MAMHIHPMDLSISISKLIELNLNMGNLKEFNKQKLNNNKRIKKDKKRINKILHYGKQINQINQNGHLHGDKDVLGGILNVQLWHTKFWVIKWTSIQVVLI